MFKPSIRLEEDILSPTPKLSPDEYNPLPALGIPSGKDNWAQTYKVNLGASTGRVEPNQEPEGEIAAMVGPLDPDVDWWKPISEYL
jgi:hypothetical protein